VLLFFLTAHWSKPIDFSDETLAQARSQWQGIANAFVAPARRAEARPWEDFSDTLEDDFNTPEALAILHDWRARGQIELLRRGLDVFGLAPTAEEAPASVRRLAEEREQARRRRDFARADALRDEIGAVGWEVRDGAGGPLLVRRP
jgi:cysteinyl-tRNA synthetase